MVISGVSYPGGRDKKNQEALILVQSGRNLGPWSPISIVPRPS